MLGAESFVAVDLPDVYENYATVLPKLILSGISGIKSRLVLADEAQRRDLKHLSDARISLIEARAKLIDDLDKVLLGNDSDANKAKRRRDIFSGIKSKDTEIEEYDERIRAKMEESRITEDAIEGITLWKEGRELYQRKAATSLGKSLREDSLSGLITGSLEDVGGYLRATVTLDTGLGSNDDVTVSEAVAYEDIESLVSLVVARLVPTLTNRKPVTLQITVEPDDARLFVDGKLIVDRSAPITVFAGEHSIGASAPGYVSSERLADFGTLREYTISVELVKAHEIAVAFDAKRMKSDLYFHTKHYGETPSEISLPSFPTIGEAVSGDVKTYFVFNPERLQGKDSRSLIIDDNKVNTEKRIEERRRTLYWSLGLLYISLPLSMLSYGISVNKENAYYDGKISGSHGVIDEINAWNTASKVTRGITIGLGINVAIQLIRYILAAEQTIPKEAR